MKRLAIVIASLALLAAAPVAAEAKTAEDGGYSTYVEDGGGGGWTWISGPVYYGGPYGYGPYCWFFHPFYGHRVLPC